MSDSVRAFFRKTIDLIALLLWCAMIFVFSGVPSLQSGLKEDFLYRKIAHMVEYAVLAYLFCNVAKRRIGGIGFGIVFAVLAALCYALTDEIHQTFVRGRSGNFFDIGIDACGIFMFVGLWLARRFIRRPQQNHRLVGGG